MGLLRTLALCVLGICLVAEDTVCLSWIKGSSQDGLQQALIPAPYASNIPSPFASSIPVPYPSTIPVPIPSNIPVPYPSPIPVTFPSNIPSPFASSIPVPYPSIFPVPIASNIPAPFASTIPVPFASPIPVPFTSNIPAPCASNIPCALLSICNPGCESIFNSGCKCEINPEFGHKYHCVFDNNYNPVCSRYPDEFKIPLIQEPPMSGKLTKIKDLFDITYVTYGINPFLHVDKIPAPPTPNPVFNIIPSPLGLSFPFTE